jgi:hypothetical protein
MVVIPPVPDTDSIEPGEDADAPDSVVLGLAEEAVVELEVSSSLDVAASEGFDADVADEVAGSESIAVEAGRFALDIEEAAVVASTMGVTEIELDVGDTADLLSMTVAVLVLVLVLVL